MGLEKRDEKEEKKRKKLFELVSEGSECKGKEKYVGRVRNVQECGEKCKGISTMFIFGNPKWCFFGKCKCFCETAANDEGECKQATNHRYRLFKFNLGESITTCTLHRGKEWSRFNLGRRTMERKLKNVLNDANLIE